VRRATLAGRIAKVLDIVGREPDEPWLIWCGLNDESTALARAIPGAVEVSGRDSYAEKKAAIKGFVDGTIRVIVTKPTIAGFGLNWQHCAHETFFPSHSFDQWYQCL
jgi:hypothetical protein